MDNKLYDFTSLEAVCAGDKDFMGQMVELFKINIPLEVELIKAAVKNNDYEDIKRIAHKMKPSIGYICVESMVAEVKLIEEWEGNPEALEEMVTIFVDRLSLVMKQLQEL